MIGLYRLKHTIDSFELYKYSVKWGPPLLVCRKEDGRQHVEALEGGVPLAEWNWGDVVN